MPALSPWEYRASAPQLLALVTFKALLPRLFLGTFNPLVALGRKAPREDVLCGQTRRDTPCAALIALSRRAS